jgi:hypothetical protein
MPSRLLTANDFRFFDSGQWISELKPSGTGLHFGALLLIIVAIALIMLRGACSAPAGIGSVPFGLSFLTRA